MTPADAATSYALSFKNYLSTADQERLREAFTKGLEWAVADPDVLREILGLFAEWFGRNYEQSLSGDKWLERGKNPVRSFTTNQILEKYLQHLQTIKQKEDEAGTNS